MDNTNLSRIQKAIGIAAVVYIIMPDLFFGPIDDTAIAGIATILEIVLGIIKKSQSKGSSEIY